MSRAIGAVWLNALVLDMHCPTSQERKNNNVLLFNCGLFFTSSYCFSTLQDFIGTDIFFVLAILNNNLKDWVLLSWAVIKFLDQIVFQKNEARLLSVGHSKFSSAKVKKASKNHSKSITEKNLSNFGSDEKVKISWNLLKSFWVFDFDVDGHFVPNQWKLDRSKVF